VSTLTKSSFALEAREECAGDEILGFYSQGKPEIEELLDA